MKQLTKKDRQEFIKKYNIDSKILRKCRITLKDAELIIQDYEKIIPQLENIAVLLTTQLQKNNDVHSVRFRVKNREHLIEKIIRKNFENPDRKIGIDNYKKEITDLIGIRVLHIFKEEWDNINDFIKSTFLLKEDENPKAYHKKGDSDIYLEKFRNKDIETYEHKFGYRSIHYIIQTNPTKVPVFAEIQVRTIYEEAWSEIDHRIRYPYRKDHKLYSQILYILNGLSHNADEVGSFINNLKKIYEDFSNQLTKKESQIKEIYQEIDTIPLPDHMRDLIKHKLVEIAQLDTDAKTDINQVIGLLKNLNTFPKS